MSYGTAPLGTRPHGAVDAATGPVSHNLDGAATGEATGAGSVSKSTPLDGAATGEATAAGGVTHTVPLAGAATGAATAGGSLSKTDTLAGAAYAGHSVFSRPEADLAAGTFVAAGGGALYAAVDEEVANDADYIYNTTNDFVWARIKLATIADPGTHDAQQIQFRAWNGGALAFLFLYLHQGETLIASAIQQIDSAVPTDYVYDIPPSQAATITDYSALEFRMLVTGGTANVSKLAFKVTEPGVVAAADLTHSVPIAGAGLAVATAQGAMSINIPLAGTGQAAATATGDLSVTAGGTADLAAAATATATATGDLSLSIPLSGSAVSQALAQAGITHVVPLGGAASSGHTVYARPDGTIDGDGYTPVGAATIHECLNEVTPNDATYIYGAGNSVEVSLQNIPDPGISTGHVVRFRAKADSGWLAVTLRQGATTIASKYYYGDFPAVWTDDSFTLTPAEADAITDYSDLRLALAGLIGTTYYSWAAFSVDVPGVGASGGVSINISLSGAAIAEAAAGADLSVAGGGVVVDLAGNAQAQASATGDLTHSIPLTGSSVVVSSASGGLSHIVQLSGSAASASMMTGGLDVGVTLDGAALAQALASAVLDAEKHLGGAADAEALADATLTLRVTLDGAALAQAIAAGALTTYSLLDSATLGWDISAPARDWTIIAAARDWTVSAMARDWSIAA